MISTSDQQIPATTQNESESERRFSITQPQQPLEETDHSETTQPLAPHQLQLPPNASEIVNKLVTATYTTRFGVYSYFFKSLFALVYDKLS